MRRPASSHAPAAQVGAVQTGPARKRAPPPAAPLGSPAAVILDERVALWPLRPSTLLDSSDSAPGSKSGSSARTTRSGLGPPGVSPLLLHRSCVEPARPLGRAPRGRGRARGQSGVKEEFFSAAVIHSAIALPKIGSGRADLRSVEGLRPTSVEARETA